jgi:hypothetical protein
MARFGLPPGQAQGRVLAPPPRPGCPGCSTRSLARSAGPGRGWPNASGVVSGRRPRCAPPAEQLALGGTAPRPRSAPCACAATRRGGQQVAVGRALEQARAQRLLQRRQPAAPSSTAARAALARRPRQRRPRGRWPGRNGRRFQSNMAPPFLHSGYAGFADVHARIAWPTFRAWSFEDGKASRGSSERKHTIALFTVLQLSALGACASRPEHPRDSASLIAMGPSTAPGPSVQAPVSRPARSPMRSARSGARFAYTSSCAPRSSPAHRGTRDAPLLERGAAGLCAARSRAPGSPAATSISCSWEIDQSRAAQ